MTRGGDDSYGGLPGALIGSHEDERRGKDPSNHLCLFQQAWYRLALSFTWMFLDLVNGTVGPLYIPIALKTVQVLGEKALTSRIQSATAALL